MTSTLYRSFLRVLEKWPIDTTKKSRDLGEHIRLCLAEAFRAGEPRGSNQCQEIQESLSRIASNKYKEAFYISTNPSATGLAEAVCQQLISNEFIELMETEDKGTVQGIKEKLFKEDRKDK